MIIKNENLFRALVCGPSAIAFGLFAKQSFILGWPLVMQAILTVITLYFAYTALAHAALYTNERTEGKAESAFENQNLGKLVKFTPFAIIFTMIAVSSVTSPANILFKVIFVLMAIYFLYSALAAAAHYTNDCYDAEDIAH